jgi:hypothetical protein
MTGLDYPVENLTRIIILVPDIRNHIVFYKILAYLIYGRVGGLRKQPNFVINV